MDFIRPETFFGGREFNFQSFSGISSLLFYWVTPSVNRRAAGTVENSGTSNVWDTIQISFWFLLPNKRLEKLVAERTANLEKRTFQLARLASQLTLAEQRLIPGRIQITGRFLQLQPFPISGLPREPFYSVISSGPVSL